MTKRPRVLEGSSVYVNIGTIPGLRKKIISKRKGETDAKIIVIALSPGL